MEKKADVCFEASWEVCNKVGGIYTVVKSKVLPALDVYGEGYFLIGPFFPDKAHGIFEELAPPDHLAPVCDRLRGEGIEVHFGTWLVKGKPKVFLIDFSKFSPHNDRIKGELWEWYGIDSLNTEFYDFDEPVVWAYCVGRLVQEAQKALSGKKIVAQFHEWLSAVASLFLKHHSVPVGTVFTTHATTLGRSLATGGRNLYLELDSLDPDAEARNIGPGVFAKHLVEKKSAEHSDVFTTVSEITGIEAGRILGRKPDVLLFNGLDMDKFPTFEEASVRHRFFKARIKQFLIYYFFPYYEFDLDKTLIYFIAGRYEFRDKGIDVFIKSLSRLNSELREQGDDRTIVAFFWVPAHVKGISPDLVQSKTLFFDVKDSIDDNEELVKSRLLRLLITGKELTSKSLLGSDLYDEVRPKVLKVKRREKGTPPLSTHELFDEGSDQIMGALRASGLNNAQDDPVKVVYYPIYLTGADGLLDTSYYESMIGSDLGVFPSYYEPWGYTPLEAAALGISSLTTDLSGFGRYICGECEARPKYPGIFVLNRFKRSEDEIVEELKEMMRKFEHFSAKERTENKIAAQKIALTADWDKFFQRYVQAHNLAVERLS